MPDDERSGQDSRATRASLDEPPRGTLLDRLARLLEGGGRGAPAPVVVDLARVLDPSDLARLPRAVIDLYAAPETFDVRAGYEGGPWSRMLVAVLGAVTRQMNLSSADGEERAEGSLEPRLFPIGQITYVDRRGRTHWDRYVRARGRWRRLFVARVSGAPGFMTETFTIYGVPAPLPFAAKVEGGALVLTLVRRWYSPMSWISRVVYRTEVFEGPPREVVTHGDFRVPLAGFHVRTEFRARLDERGR